MNILAEIKWEPLEYPLGGYNRLWEMSQLLTHPKHGPMRVLRNTCDTYYITCPPSFYSNSDDLRWIRTSDPLELLCYLVGTVPAVTQKVSDAAPHQD